MFIVTVVTDYYRCSANVYNMHLILKVEAIVLSKNCEELPVRHKILGDAEGGIYF